MSLSDKIYRLSPHIVQEVIITLYDVLQYRKRHGGVYQDEKEYLRSHDYSDLDTLMSEQSKLLGQFLSYCKQNSAYYKERIGDIDLVTPLVTLSTMAPISKEELRVNQKEIKTIDKAKAFVGKTGGTTGKSLEVYYIWEDAQRRFAMLDVFRERFGYSFGKKTAWFSGKALLSSRDVRKHRFWKNDFVHSIRYYSTFHISEKYMSAYIEDLRKYKPEFIVGFPSSIVEIARYGLRNNLEPLTSIKAIFPTAEAKDPVEARDMHQFFGAEVRDQYASSEGANFITECEEGNLHYDMLTGIIEVVDENYRPAKEGRILVTPFGTRGTPLIRYDIGDRIRWSDKLSCPCGRHTPLVDAILGRVNDYLWSPENGKINLGNVSNCVKNIAEIVKFQAIQEDENSIVVKIVKSAHYSDTDEHSFLKELRYRTGERMKVEIEYVDDIPSESSGKYRLIKNNWAKKTK